MEECLTAGNAAGLALKLRAFVRDEGQQKIQNRKVTSSRHTPNS